MAIQFQSSLDVSVLVHAPDARTIGQQELTLVWSTTQAETCVIADVNFAEQLGCNIVITPP